jgi:tripartite-type tricarboxylate transporter receptor subunit TctC
MRRGTLPATVENLPGGAGSGARDRVSKSPPEGYTLCWGANGAVRINPSLQVGAP